MKNQRSTRVTWSIRSTSHSTADLLRSRANLSHLIYFMEHDRSLEAEESKIGSLRNLLKGIERQIVSREHFRQHTHPT